MNFKTILEIGVNLFSAKDVNVLKYLGFIVKYKSCLNICHFKISLFS